MYIRVALVFSCIWPHAGTLIVVCFVNIAHKSRHVGGVNNQHRNVSKDYLRQKAGTGEGDTKCIQCNE